MGKFFRLYDWLKAITILICNIALQNAVSQFFKHS